MQGLADLVGAINGIGTPLQLLGYLVVVLTVPIWLIVKKWPITAKQGFVLARLAIFLLFIVVLVLTLMVGSAVAISLVGNKKASDINGRIEKDAKELLRPLVLTKGEKKRPEVDPELADRLSNLAKETEFYGRAGVPSFSQVADYAGRLRYHENQPQQAEILFKAALSAGPTSHILNDLAVAEISQGKKEQAIGHLKDALTLDPTFIPALIDHPVLHLTS